MQESILQRILAKLKPNGGSDAAGIRLNSPAALAAKYPDVPKPLPRLSLEIVAAGWVCRDIGTNEMPGIAADLLEAGVDSPALRRLAEKTKVIRSTDLDELVAQAFRELEIPNPLPKREMRLVMTRQIAREVIAGQRDPIEAAAHLEFVIWDWEPGTRDIVALFNLHGELNWDPKARRPLAEVTADILDAFARLAMITNQEIFAAPQRSRRP